MAKKRIIGQRCSHYHESSKRKRDIDVLLEITADNSNGEKLTGIVCDYFLRMSNVGTACGLHSSKDKARDLHLSENEITPCIYTKFEKLY